MSFNRPSIYDLNSTQYETFVNGAKPEKSLYAEQLKREKLNKQVNEKETHDAVSAAISKFSKGNNKNKSTTSNNNCNSSSIDRSEKKKAALASFLKDVKHNELIKEGRNNRNINHQQQIRQYICYDYQNGRCRYGRYCKYSHEDTYNDNNHSNNREETSTNKRRIEQSNLSTNNQTLTTNVFISNISTNVTLDQLRLTFETFGRVAKVEMMPPRENAACTNGFVAFFRRLDAENALSSIKSGAININERCLSGGWGIALNPEQLVDLNKKDSLLRTIVMGDDQNETGDNSIQGSQEIPPLLSSDKTNRPYKKYKTSNASSFTSSSTMKQLPIGSFLIEKDQYQLSLLLKSLDLTARSITNAMMFCLKHSYAAPSIVKSICKEAGFVEPDDEEDDRKDFHLLTSAPKQIACLYLLSDLLSNSSCSKQGASMYRSSIEEVLLMIMLQLRLTHINIFGRITADAMKNRIYKILNVWDTWGVFTTRFVKELRQTFDVGKIIPSKTTSASAVSNDIEEDLDGEPIENAENSKNVVAVEENDDEEDDDDLDGEPLDDVDLDGEPLDEEDGLDGEPM